MRAYGVVREAEAASDQKARVIVVNGLRKPDVVVVEIVALGCNGAMLRNVAGDGNLRV